MHEAIVKFEGVAPYTQGRALRTERGQNEKPDEHDERCWRERMTLNEKGYVMVPASAPYLAMIDACKYLGLKVPGRRNATYTKHFTSGVVALEPAVLPIHGDEVAPQMVFTAADGKPGGSTRVWRRFPFIPMASFKGEWQFMVADALITKETFTQVIDAAGKFIGIGTFRPQKRGFHGRWKVTKVKWT